MLERPRQDWDDALADYVVTERTAKGIEPPSKSGCLPVLIALALAAIVILGG